MRVFHPDFGGPINVGATVLSDDPDTQVGQVIQMMREYSVADSESPELVYDGMRASSQGGPIPGTFRAVKSRLRFIQDESTAEPFTAWLKGPIVETLVRPIDMRRMQHPQGDCDDFSMSTAALLRAQGIPASFVTVAVDPDDPSRYSHVYVIADCSGGVCGPQYEGRVSLDTSHGEYPGWEAPNPFGKRKEWPLDYRFDWPVLLIAAAAAGVMLWWVFKQ